MTITAPPLRTRSRVQPRTPAVKPIMPQPGRGAEPPSGRGRSRAVPPDAVPARGRGGPPGSADAPPGRPRSAASQRAYARKAQRTAVATGQRRSVVARTPFVLLVMATLATGLIVSLWLSTAASADSYRLEQARLQARSLSERAAQLQQEVANLQTAPELAARARALGMVPSSEPAHLVVQPDGTVTVVGEPAAATAPPVPPAGDPASGAPAAGAGNPAATAGATPTDPAGGAPAGAAAGAPTDPAGGVPADPAGGVPAGAAAGAPQPTTGTPNDPAAATPPAPGGG